MPVVRCPSCDRRLHLPDSVIGLDARCPMCAAVFPAEPEGGRPRPVGETPTAAPDPGQPWRPRGEPSRRGSGPEPLPDRFPRSGETSDPERDRLARMGSWLFGLSIAGLAWDMTCGCMGVAVTLDNSMARDEYAVLAFMGAHFGHLVALVVLLFAGQAMRNARNPALCKAGVWVAACEVLFFAARVAMLAYSSRRTRSDMGPGLLLVNLGVPVVMFVAGMMAAGVLARPGVQEALARSRPRPEEEL
ncbi:MAG: hypothetical protein K2W96_10040 [Gemmataceae bacterium]|nr:hypothetical protein [Gemmataceae bacterium]